MGEESLKRVRNGRVVEYMQWENRRGETAGNGVNGQWKNTSRKTKCDTMSSDTMTETITLCVTFKKIN